MFFRAIFIPTLASALTGKDHAAVVSAFAERLTMGLRRRLEDSVAS